MRILHVTPYYAPAWAWGGVVAAVTGLSRAQVQADHQVAVLTTDTLGPGMRGSSGSATLDGVEIWRVPTRSMALRARYNLSWPIGFGQAARRTLRSTGFQVVHCHELRTLETLLAVRAAARAGIPVLLSPHGTLPRTTGRTVMKLLWDALLSRRILRHIGFVVALTPAEAEQAVRLWARTGLELPATRIAVIPNGVDPALRVQQNERLTAREALGIPTDHQVVLFLGRLHRRKRIPLLLAAFAELVEHCPQTVLLLAGPDHGALSEIQASITRHALDDKVVITGMVSGEAARTVLASADVLGLPGLGEGMPMAALEGLAAGIPVVLSEESGLGEVTTAGAGFVVGHECAAIAAALEQVVRANRHGETMRRNAHRFAVTRFSWPVVVADIDRAIMAMTASNAGHDR